MFHDIQHLARRLLHEIRQESQEKVNNALEDEWLAGSWVTQRRVALLIARMTEHVCDEFTFHSERAFHELDKLRRDWPKLDVATLAEELGHIRRAAKHLDGVKNDLWNSLEHNEATKEGRDG